MTNGMMTQHVEDVCISVLGYMVGMKTFSIVSVLGYMVGVKGVMLHICAHACCSDCVRVCSFNEQF